MSDIIEKLKEEIMMTETALEIEESRFSKKVKDKNRRYSNKYLKKAVKSAYLYGQLQGRGG